MHVGDPNSLINIAHVMGNKVAPKIIDVGTIRIARLVKSPWPYKYGIKMRLFVACCRAGDAGLHGSVLCRPPGAGTCSGKLLGRRM
jgi:hypothetical protein